MTIFYQINTFSVSTFFTNLWVTELMYFILFYFIDLKLKHYVNITAPFSQHFVLLNNTIYIPKNIRIFWSKVANKHEGQKQIISKNLSWS